MDKKEFEDKLLVRLMGDSFIKKIWLNYPNSTFYYLPGDKDFKNEIGIYTKENAYGIYI
jgi:hypothetical protein